VNLAVVGSFVFFILCLVADFHEISNRFFKFLWDGSESRSLIFWVGWAIFLVPFTMCIGGAIIDSPHQFFGSGFLAPYIANIVGGTIALGALFGVPFWTIIRPRVNRYKHTLRVKQADAAIAQLFNPL